MDARMILGLGVELRLWNWPVFMQLQMNVPIRRALMLSFRQNNTCARARARRRRHPPCMVKCTPPLLTPPINTARKG